jgi:hypothetical protein
MAMSIKGADTRRTKVMKRTKSRKKTNSNALTIVSDPQTDGRQPSVQQIQQSAESKEISEAAKRGFAKLMRETFGTEDQALQDRLLCQAASAVSDFGGRELKTFDHLAAAMRGIRPQDSLEGMLATQMVAVHTLAMTCMGRAALPDQSDLGVEVNLNRATKLMRSFVLQTEALGRYRGKGEQKMVVEHVHVHKGGQAIVGPVNPNTSRRNPKHGSSGNERE